MNITNIAEQIKTLGNDIEIITHGSHANVSDLKLALENLKCNVVVHAMEGQKEQYFNYDVQVLIGLSEQFFPNEHSKTMVILDNQSDRLSDHLSTSDKWILDKVHQTLVQHKNPIHLMYQDNYETQWLHILNTYPILRPYIDHNEENRSKLIPIYAGPISEHAIDQLSVIETVDYIKKKLYEGATHILFDDKDEALYWNRIYTCHNIIKRLKHILPKGRVLFLTGALNGQEIYSDWCKKNNVEEEIIMLPAARFESVSKDMMFDRGLISHYSEMDTPVNTNKREKKYLCYNRMPRLHRIKIITELHKANLINQGFVSFYDLEEHLEKYKWVLTAIKTPEWAETFNYFYNKVYPELDYNLNKTEKRWNPADLQKDDLTHFSESYFSIVNETLFYKEGYHSGHMVDIQLTNSVFLSEKIYKPLACKHPFVVVGVDKTLEYLKKFGYKTFDQWIDESYDQEPDDDKRMGMVVEEIKRLTALSDEEWQRMIVEMIPTLQHNFITLCRAKNLITANINYSSIFRNGQEY
ncbi:hypothetical protein N9I01_00190 [bacterium]|nr:hypothetical protein [bacterium]